MAISGILFIFTALVLTQDYMPTVVADDCLTEIQNITSTLLIIAEGAITGQVLANVTGLVVAPGTGTPHVFVTVTDGAIIIAQNISLDGPNNAERCAIMDTRIPEIQIMCSGIQTSVTDVYFVSSFTDDFSPWFIQSEIKVPETDPVGATVLMLENITVDEDCTNYFVFSIDEASKKYFHILNNVMSLAQQLDYELTPVHYVNLTVQSTVERVQDWKYNSTILIVRVKDVDDMPPVFDINLFVLHVKEGQNLSDIWLDAIPPILARDGDTGINTTLSYSLQDVSPQVHIEIQNASAQIQVMDVLDRENVSSYRAIIKAAQVDLPYKSATATFSLVVYDVNDNRPFYTSETNITIREDAPTGSNVMELTGEDLDEGANAQFSFSIGKDDIGAFGVLTQPGTHRTYLVVRNNTALRGRNQTSVQIILTELQLPEGGDTCDFTTICGSYVTIHIDDVNDNSPIFDSPKYEFTLFGNISWPAFVGQITAIDADLGDNARVEYSIAQLAGPGECSHIKINTTTGTLTSSQQLSAGVDCSWLVTACDSPPDLVSRRCSSVHLSVSVGLSGGVVDLNVTVLENVPVGTMVTGLSVKNLHTASIEFEIRNNMLYTKVSLDREKHDKYLVEVYTGTDASSIVMNIHVTVDDVNDNAPIFGQTIYTINLSSDLPINSELLKVNASDDDLGNNALFTFSLTTGKDYFDIDAKTGQIRLLNFPTTSYIECQLVVSDFGQPMLQGFSVLKAYTHTNNGTATLMVPVSMDKVTADRAGVEKKLSSILGVTVRILNIESVGQAPDLGSKLYVGATSASGQVIESADLNALLEKHAIEIFDKFGEPEEEKVQESSDKLSVLEIILICVVCVLLLAVVLIVVLLSRSRRKYKKSVRLFDTLNRDTAIYDNPIKPKNATSVVTDETSNAERMLARLSDGSIGHSSVAKLIPSRQNGNGTENVPLANTDQVQQRTPYYENVVLSQGANYLSDGDNNHRDNHALLASALTSEDAITAVGAPVLGEVEALPEPDVQPIPRSSLAPETDLDTSQTGEVWISDNTPLFDRRNVSDSDSGMTSEREIQPDENDQEVAHILSETHASELSQSPKDDVDSSTNESNPNLTSLMRPVPAVTSYLDPHQEMATTSDQDVESVGVDVLPEPEPDYAKKVRFSEAVDKTEKIDNVNNDNGNMSLGKFLTQHAGNPQSEVETVNTNAEDDSIEELTAL